MVLQTDCGGIGGSARPPVRRSKFHLVRNRGVQTAGNLCARSHFRHQVVSPADNLTKLRRSVVAWAARLVFQAVVGLIKTLVVGIILGLVGAAALTHFVPVVDLHRERSLISVQANGGNSEVFRIDLPRDRVLVGLAGEENSFPAGLKWPADESLGNFQVEIFKVRDRNNMVIGIASRLASSTEETGGFIEWTIHLPARGTLYAQMDLAPSEGGYRNGVMRAGSRDFEEMRGSIREHFIADVEEKDYDVESRIELVTALVGSSDANADDYLAATVGDVQ